MAEQLDGWINLLLDEVRHAVSSDDRWVLVALNLGNDGVGVELDTIWAGFQDHAELRGPRWRPFQDAYEFFSLYPHVVAGDLTLCRFLAALNTTRTANAIMHVEMMRQHLSTWAEPRHAVRSLEHGFVSEGHPSFRSLHAPRPGRVTRRKLRERCENCGTDEGLTLHHLVARRFGGATEPLNLLCVCRECHDSIENGQVSVEAQLHERMTDASSILGRIANGDG